MSDGVRLLLLPTLSAVRREISTRSREVVLINSRDTSVSSRKARHQFDASKNCEGRLTLIFRHGEHKAANTVQRPPDKKRHSGLTRLKAKRGTAFASAVTQ